MSTTTHRRVFDCPVDGKVVLDEACCPVCTRPLECVDGATQDRYGYGEVSSLCYCDHCPADERDRVMAFEVTFTDVRGWGLHCGGTPERAIERTETAVPVGMFDGEGVLVTFKKPGKESIGHLHSFDSPKDGMTWIADEKEDPVISDAFRLHFPELCDESPKAERDDRFVFVVILAAIIVAVAVLA